MTARPTGEDYRALFWLVVLIGFLYALIDPGPSIEVHLYDGAELVELGAAPLPAGDL